jgi:crotonobetainyl-CoA:carnitine CoA-transferase CaiB-like acyl-CoA transferase
MDKRPLAAIRVLDLTRLLPGPMCTLHLADLGADVIKVEDPQIGDYARELGVVAGEVSSLYTQLNRNKRSVALDFKLASARDVFLRLAARADVIVEGFRPGIVAKLGVGYDAVHAINPRIVYCSISGYGQTGPYRDRAGHDINYVAYAGVLDQIGVADGPPALSNLPIGDLLGGALTASTAILAALLAAKLNGEGCYIDTAMAESTLAHGVFALHALNTQGHSAPRGEDMVSGRAASYGVYRTRDHRWLAVGALERKFWDLVCDTLERPDLKPFHTATGEEGQATRRLLEAIFARETLAHWVEKFAGVDCCVAPVLTVDEAITNEQFVARDMIVRDAQGRPQFASPFKLSNAPFTIVRPAPRLGEHTDEVLREAGLSGEEIAALNTAQRRAPTGTLPAAR